MTIDTKRLATDPEYWRECGAPEDATHYDPSSEAGYPSFMKVEGGRCLYFSRVSHEWVAHTMRRVGKFIPRPTPKTASEEWVDGLPPIGEYCEVSVVGQKFINVEVRGYYNEMVWLSGHGVGQIVEHVSDCRFRTKQERQRDELADLIADNIEITLENDSFHIGAGKAVEAIIADGWTKP